MYLSAHPLCQCEANNGAGCGYPATVVDHRIPHNDDWALAFSWDNLQAMTKVCHDKKTVARDGGFGNPRR
jgi:5-methylcytosine-specific restriction protein A